MTAKKIAQAVDPLVQRDELLETLARVDARGDVHDAQARDASAALGTAERTLAESRIGEVTGEATSTDVQRAETGRAKAKTAVEALAPEAVAIEAARKRTVTALVRLHSRHREAFEAEAEAASRAAEESLMQLAPNLRDAAEAWAEAQGAWSRATSWLNHIQAPSLNPEHQLGRVPDFPLKLTIGATQPRPHERRAEADGSELIPDRLVIFGDSRKNGAERRVVLGSAMWREMIAASSRFTFLRYEEPTTA